MLPSIISGDKVQLRLLREEDLERRAQWTADDELAEMNCSKEPFVSHEDEVRGNREWFKLRRSAGDILYAIEADGEYIGDVVIETHTKDGVVELTLFIGNKSQWGKGYGTESATLILRHLSSDKGMKTCQVCVHPNNERTLRFWQRLGFEKSKVDQHGDLWLKCSKAKWASTTDVTC